MQPKTVAKPHSMTFFFSPPHLAAQTDKENNVFNTTSCIDKPYRCPHPKIKFFLYTRSTQEYGEQIDVLNPESLWNSHWNPVHPVKVVIHGE
jgi:pancreatic lipase-related protein 1